MFLISNLNFSLKLVGALTSKPYTYRARVWELERLEFFDFYDGMLGNIFIDIRGQSIMRVLPRINEYINEEWVSDKIRFSYDAFRRQRLLIPLYKDILNKKYKEISWEESFFIFFYNYNLFNYDFLNKNSLQGIIGRFVDLESMVSLKEFFSKFEDSIMSIKFKDNISFYENSEIFNFKLNIDYNKIEELESCLFFGLNLRYESPVLHLKLLRAVNKGLIVFSLMSSFFKIKNYSLGNTVEQFLKFLEGRNRIAILFTKIKKKLILVGESLLKKIDGKNFHKIFFFLKNYKCLINIIHSNISRLNFLFLGFFKLNKILYNKENMLLFLYNVDEFLNLKKVIKNFKIYQGHHGDKGSLEANLIFPSTFLIEKKGNFFDLKGNILNYNFIIKPSDFIRTDWRIFSALSIYFFKKKKIFITYLDILNRSFFLLPNILKKSLDFDFKLLEDNLEVSFRFYNIIGFSIYIDYFSSDSVTRASKVMLISSFRFRKSFYNF